MYISVETASVSHNRADLGGKTFRFRQSMNINEPVLANWKKGGQYLTACVDGAN